MNTQKTAWDFVEEHYPDYSSCENIAENNDLKVLINEKEEDGSRAWELKQSIISDYKSVFPYHSYDEREEYRMKVYNEIFNRYHESCACIFKKAIEAFQEKQSKSVSVNWSISDVDQVMEDNDIQFPFSEFGKLEILKYCKDNFDANTSYWDNLLESVNRIINQSSANKAMKITAEKAFNMMLNRDKVKLSKEGKVNHPDIEDKPYQIEWINLDTELCLWDEEKEEAVYDICLEDIEITWK